MPKRLVGEGESTSSLAKKKGFYWKTIWEHGENAELRQKRDDPNVLSADADVSRPMTGRSQLPLFTSQSSPAS